MGINSTISTPLVIGTISHLDVSGSISQSIIVGGIVESAFENITPPTDLSLTVLGDTIIRITWNDNSSDEEGFRIYYSTDNITFVELATVSANIETYTATGLAAGTEYWFYVVAYRDTTESVATDIKSTSTIEIYLTDTFIDTNGSLLSDHTMDKGPGWSALSSWVINNNKLTNNTTGGAVYAITEAGISDYIISCDMTFPASGNFAGAIRFRYQDEAHGLAAGIEKDNVGNAYVILVRDSTTLGKVDITYHANSTYKLIVSCIGNAIDVYWPAPETPTDPIISVTESAYNTLTKCGLSGVGLNNYKIPVMDNFFVADTYGYYFNITIDREDITIDSETTTMDMI